MFNTLARRLVPLYVLAAVLTIPLLQHAWQLHSTRHIAQDASSQLTAHKTSKTIEGTPVRIVVPDAAIDLPIVPGSQNPVTHVWSVSNDKANYALITAKANNQSGMPLIYGHNSHRIFGALLDLKIGAEVFIYTDNNHIFKYTFSNSENLTPNRRDLFQTLQSGTGMALMTCDGQQFQYRRVMFFKLEQAS